MFQKTSLEKAGGSLLEVFEGTGELTPAFSDRWDARFGFYADNAPTDLFQEEVESLKTIVQRDQLWEGIDPKRIDDDFTARFRTLLETLAETEYPEFRNIPEGKMFRIRLRRDILATEVTARGGDKDEVTRRGQAAAHATPEDDRILVLPTIAPKIDESTGTLEPVPLPNSFTAFFIYNDYEGQKRLVVDTTNTAYGEDDWEIQVDYRRNNIW